MLIESFGGGYKKFRKVYTHTRAREKEEGKGKRKIIESYIVMATQIACSTSVI